METESITEQEVEVLAVNEITGDPEVDAQEEGSDEEA